MAEGDPKDRPGYSFNPGPPPEASRFLRNKGLRPAFSFLDVEPEEHAVSFTVAKVMELDLLAAMQGEVQKALDEGLPFEAFAKSWRSNPKLAEWWGRKAIEDPLTGEVIDAQLGSPRRLKVIYDANLRTARAAGQWERIERTKNAFPFLEYRLGSSEHHRAHHADKAGLILPVGHPFWDEWMPPNGWGCKCWVRQVTKGEALRRGPSQEPKVADKIWVNPRTGDRRLVPEGIDPGWERNPGKLRLQQMEAMLKDRLATAPPAVAKAAVLDIATSWRAARVLTGQGPGAIPVGILPPDVAKAVGMTRRVVTTTAEYGQKFLTKERQVSVETLQVMAEALESGMLLIEEGGDSKSLLVVSQGDQPWLFVLKLLPDAGEVWIRSMYRVKSNKLKALLANPKVSVIRG